MEKTLGLVINVHLTQNNETKNIVNNKIERVTSTSSFRDILSNVLERTSQILELDDVIQAYVASKATWDDEAEIDMDETVDLAFEVMNARHVRFVITRIPPVVLPPSEPPRRSVTDVLMGTSKESKKLELIAPKDKSCELYNAVLSDMQGEEKLLRGSSSQEDAADVLKKLTNAIWYLDGRAEIINEASRKRKNVEPLPDIVNKYQGYQRWKEWKKKPRLDQATCQLHANNLLNIVDKRCILWPAQWKDDIVQISSSLSSYVTELSNSNDGQQERQLQLHPAREISTNAEYRYLPPVSKNHFHKEWRLLSDKVHEMDMFDPLWVTTFSSQLLPHVIDFTYSVY